jgi:hypothetical protein
VTAPSCGRCIARQSTGRAVLPPAARRRAGRINSMSGVTLAMLQARQTRRGRQRDLRGSRGRNAAPAQPRARAAGEPAMGPRPVSLRVKALYCGGVRVGRPSSDLVCRRARFQLLEPQFQLIEQFAAALSGLPKPFALHLGDQQLEIGDHRLDAGRSSLRLLAWRRNTKARLAARLVSLPTPTRKSFLCSAAELYPSEATTKEGTL